MLGLLLKLAPVPDPSSVGASPPQSQSELLHRFAALPGLSAHYREEKTMALLAAPLVSEGEIYFIPPGRLARHQRKPERASVHIDATSLRVTDKTGDKVVTLADNPVLQLFVQSFVQILAGDQEALQATYAMQYRTEADGTWSLTLEPKLDPIDRIIERIELQGRDVVLSSMEVVEVGGDRTLTRFSRVDPRRTFSASELREIFGTPHD